MPTEVPGNSFFIRCRNAFFSGALLLAPLLVTIWAFGFIIDVVVGPLRPLYRAYIPTPLQEITLLWDLLATAAVVVCVTALGFLSHYVFGKFFLRMAERAVQSIPGVGAVYNSVKQLVSTFGTQSRNTFSKVVLVEYPRKGCWSLGFLTNTARGEAQSHLGGEIWTVFVPTTPNPTSGFLLLLPRGEIIELEMSVGDGMKMIISGGAVMPEWKPKSQQPPA